MSRVVSPICHRFHSKKVGLEGNDDSSAELWGSGGAHLERNWGESFPEGWVWAQAHAPSARAQLILTGGLFKVGPLTTNSYVVALRTPQSADAQSADAQSADAQSADGQSADGQSADGQSADGGGALSWNFRSTDLDQISAARQPCAGRLLINATSRDRSRRLELRLFARPDTFGSPIPVPTLDGFSAVPGCRESYAAIVELAAYERGAGARAESWTTRLQMRVPLAALEFGGSFQCERGQQTCTA